MGWRLAVPLVGFSAIFLPLPSLAQPAVPDVPKEITVPPGHKLLFKFNAKGVQIYKAVQGKAGKLEWVLEAPLADLIDEKNGKAGWHYDGPSWEATDGSKVVRDKAEEVKSTAAPKPQEHIPWLLVKVKADDGKDGVLSPVVYIQRLQTEGGKSPSEVPKRVQNKIGVAYWAVYFFYGPVK